MDININRENCPMTYTINAIGGKWKILILYMIFKEKVVRYGRLKKIIPDISHKVLNSQLKELMEYDLISRIEYAEIPPKVEYKLTEKGKGVIPLLKSMYIWGEQFVK
ncbi:MAG: winged helix-turn-helix transcriptional regulator [Clostridiaceae bacterium]